MRGVCLWERKNVVLVMLRKISYIHYGEVLKKEGETSLFLWYDIEKGDRIESAILMKYGGAYSIRIS